MKISSPNMSRADAFPAKSLSVGLLGLAALSRAALFFAATPVLAEGSGGEGGVIRVNLSSQR